MLIRFHSDDAEREIRTALRIDAVVLPKGDWFHASHLNARIHSR